MIHKANVLVLLGSAFAIGASFVTGCTDSGGGFPTPPGGTLGGMGGGAGSGSGAVGGSGDAGGGGAGARGGASGEGGQRGGEAGEAGDGGEGAVPQGGSAGSNTLGGAGGSGGANPTSGSGGSSGSGGTRGSGGSGGGETIGEPGSRCSFQGARGCADHASVEKLTCENGVWVAAGECASDERCDTRPGATAGTCQSVPVVCSDKAPGDPVCILLEVRTCGPDLLTLEEAGIYCPFRCIDGGCDGCYTGSRQCSPDNSAVQRCNADNYWEDIVACPCTNAVCEPEVVTAEGIPASVALDATHVYWIDRIYGTVMKAPKGGGTPTVLASAQIAAATDIEVDSTSVYWSAEYAEGVDGGVIMKVGLDGGEPTTLASGQCSPTSIALDATHVYWLSGTMGCPLMKVPLEGGTPTPVGTIEYGAYGLAVDATTIYVPEWWVWRVVTLPLEGGTPTTLYEYESFPPPTPRPPSPNQIVVNSTGVYWTNYAGSTYNFFGGSVVRLAHGSDELETLATVPGAEGLAVDDENAYYGSASDQFVAMVPLTGGEPFILATEQVFPMRMAVDATHLYWTTGTDFHASGVGSVMRTRIR